MPRRVSCPWFVGRSRELAAVTAALDAAAGGGTATVLIGGEAGIGKSRLVAEVAGRATAAGFAVFTGNCLDLAEGGAPYAPVHEIVAAIAASLDPDTRREVLGPDDGAGPAAVLPGALGRLTARRPVAVVVEDLHWADRSTRDLVAYLSAGPRVPSLLVVATYRRDDLARGHPLRNMLAELERADRVEHLRLEPFGPADLAEQLQGILGARPGPELTREVLERSDGNPFLAEELAATAGTGRLSEGVRELLLARVDRVGGDAQVVLRTAAVGGRRVRHATLAAVCRVEEPALSAALREAVANHLIVAEDDHYAFRHALLHEAVLADLLPGERRDLHAAYAAAIERDATLVGIGASGALVHHWTEAGRPGAALLAAIAAGLAAESAFALPEAQRYFEWALRLWDELGGPDAPIDVPLGYEELLQRAAENASRAGDLERAAELVSRALAAVDPEVDPSRAALLHERRGWCLLQAGHTTDALGAYDHAVALVPVAPPSVARARVLAASADAMERAGDLVAAREQARAAIAAAIAAGSPADEGHARHTLGAALAALGDPSGIDELDRALDIAEGGGDLADAVGIHLHLWRQLAPLGRAGEVVERARGGAALARAGGRAVLAGVLDGVAAGFCHQLGRWDEADSWLAAPVDGLPGVVQLVVGGALDVDRGDLERAGDRLEAARGLTAGLHDGRIDGLLFRALAERALWRGRADDAVAIVADGLDRTGDLELAARLALVGLRALDDPAPAGDLVAAAAPPRRVGAGAPPRRRGGDPGRRGDGGGGARAADRGERSVRLGACARRLVGARLPDPDPLRPLAAGGGGARRPGLARGGRRPAPRGVDERPRPAAPPRGPPPSSGRPGGPASASAPRPLPTNRPATSGRSG